MRKLTKTLLISAAIFALAACSNTPDAEQQAADDSAYSSDYTEYAKSSKIATINLDQATGKVASIEIGNQNLQAPQRKTYQDGLGQTLVKETFGTLRTAINVVANPTTALAVAAIQMNKNAGGNTHNTNSYNQHSEANQANSHSEANQANTSTVTTSTTTNTDSYNQTTDSNNQSNANPVTTNTDNSVNDSNNSETSPVVAPETEKNDGN